MDSAKHGVIVFSFGVTGFSSNVLPTKFLRTIFKSFSKLNETIIMRLNASEIDPKLVIPPNVIPCVWVPQQGILGNKYRTNEIFTTQEGQSAAKDRNFVIRRLITKIS